MSSYRPLTITRIVPESATAKSFYLAAADGLPLLAYLPGQHLPLRLNIPGHARPVHRFYTLSDCHGDENHYRLTIKREPAGTASKYLHDVLRVGDTIDAKPPAGAFTLDHASEHPVVMIAGGIGMTPMIAMLNSVVRNQPHRTVWFFLALRNHNDHAFGEHLRAVAGRLPNVKLHVSYSEPSPEDVPGTRYHRAGFVDVPLLRATLPDLDQEYFLCGPKPMMDAVIAGLTAAGVARQRIRTESFGRREVDPAEDNEAAKTPPNAAAAAADSTADSTSAATTVTFARSNKKADWDPACTSLWHFAEANGIKISSGCLYGDCGTCLTPLLAGDVVYNHPTGIAPELGTCLPCSCKPRGAVVIDA